MTNPGASRLLQIAAWRRRPELADAERASARLFGSPQVACSGLPAFSSTLLAPGVLSGATS